MVEFKWTSKKNGYLVGNYKKYSVDIFLRPHGGYCYQLIYKNGKDKIILAVNGYHATSLETQYDAKIEATKKLNFFYVQQHNKAEKV